MVVGVTETVEGKNNICYYCKKNAIVCIALDGMHSPVYLNACN